jgi:adenosylhomocysteine nucleosidase
LAEESRSLGLRLGRGDEPANLDGASLLVSGAGPDNARRAAERLLEAGAGGLISWGCAAALRPGLLPGVLLLPRRVIGHDGEVFDTDVRWHDRLNGALAGAKIPFDSGDLAESPAIVATAADKRALAARIHAGAVDMESAAVARVARDWRKPFVAIRAVADPAGMAIPPAVLQATDSNGAVNLLRLLGHLLTHPAGLPALVRLGLHFSAAIRTLRRVHRAVAPDFLLATEVV